MGHRHGYGIEIDHEHVTDHELMSIGLEDCGTSCVHLIY